MLSVIGEHQHFPGRERDEKEVLGYEALTIGLSHNYYQGRAEADITKWLEYFCDGVAESFESVKKRAREAAGSRAQDRSAALRRLDPRQRTALELFSQRDAITR